MVVFALVGLNLLVTLLVGFLIDLDRKEVDLNRKEVDLDRKECWDLQTLASLQSSEPVCAVS